MAHTAAVVRTIAETPAEPVEHARGATIQVLLGPEEGAGRFVTRHFTIAPGGRIPRHRHDSIEHEQVVLAGRMVVELDERTVEVAAGDCLLIPAGVAHSYANPGTEPVRFLCVVPHSDGYQTEWLEAPVE